MTTIDIESPILLRPDNFTPRSRTPWAGTKLAQAMKRSFCAGRTIPIGESWDFSCSGEYPSHLLRHDMTLQQLIDRESDRILGSSQISPKECQILLKVIDTSDHLSAQIHPSDNDDALGPLECGKPESWLILDAEPGAGLYLGFSRPWSMAELRQQLSGERPERIMQFVPVHQGDYFEIEAGVPHAIGAGITLLEPQRVLSGRVGKTFRMHDWGRRYDAEGKLDMKDGSPRALHVEESLRLVHPDRQWGMNYVNSLRRRPLIEECRGFEVWTYPDNGFYQLHILKSKTASKMVMNHPDGFGAFLVLQGDVVIGGPRGGKTKASEGMPALIPNASFPCSVESGADGCTAALVVPTACPTMFQAI